MFLEFDYRGGLFYVKIKNSKKNILRITPKFKILFPRLFSPGPEVSKKVCHTLVGQKLGEEIDFLETGCFWLGPYPGGQLI
jgi:hypothetical protein